MLECLLLGDSIAVGTHMFYKECELVAKNGINSWQFNKKYKGNFGANNVIISLGSNDHRYLKTKDELTKVRNRISKESKVFWILPAVNPKVQKIVKELAHDNGDVIIYIKHLQNDKIHPSWKGYKDIVQQVKDGS